MRDEPIHSPRLYPRAKAGTRIAWLLASLIFSLVCIATIDPQTMRQAMQSRYGGEGLKLLDAWSQMLDAAATTSPEEQLLQVNQFFNRHIQYSDDEPLWKKSDYWATPLETMGVRAGDCEDFTVAKYLSLLELGIPVEKLRLIYVKAQLGGTRGKIFQAHMVLGYYATPDAIPLIMDNLVDTIQPANQRPDLQPVFSFNSQGLWVGGQRAQADPTVRLSRWRDLLTRVQEEGIQLPAATTINNSVIDASVKSK